MGASLQVFRPNGGVTLPHCTSLNVALVQPMVSRPLVRYLLSTAEMPSSTPNVSLVQLAVSAPRGLKSPLISP